MMGTRWSSLRLDDKAPAVEATTAMASGLDRD